ncbi:hypothetical protein JRI60_31315 [Archangium violaceum]|uniref:hypothetical protein n=1 Tax=Archangium violaceum TaxID=83451 RepID=UPI00194E7C92|nr:hypothetical protein [Archangium violaceum]QRN93653.1 hypothetical protein JRI60_31315 [Archangium violaceum]
MDETQGRTFQPLPGVRWGAVAAGALLGAAAWLVLLRFADVPQFTRGDGPGIGLRLWWVVAPLLAAGVASWTGASASGEHGIRGAYLHGLLACAGALLLAAVAGPGSAGVLPQPVWSGLAAVVGAVTGAALGRALLAGRVAAPWLRSGLGGERVETRRSRLPWREMLTGRRSTPEARRPGAHEDAGRPDRDLH